MLKTISLLTASLLIAPVANAQAIKPNGSLNTYNDWMVGCDNTRSCHAMSVPAEGSDPDGSNLVIDIKRGGAPQDGASVVLRTNFPTDKGSYTRYVYFDNQKAPDKVSLTLQFTNGVARLRGKAAEQAIAAMREQQTIRLVDSNGDDLLSGATSLFGLKAALRNMDEQQYRTGTVSALVAAGRKPANVKSIPPISPLPALRVAGKSAKPVTTLAPPGLTGLRKFDPCQNYSEASITKAILPHYRLDAANSLLILPTTCGGYNPAMMIFVIDEKGAAQIAPFAPFSPFGGSIQDEGTLPDPVWDENARVLTAHGKAHSIGDCGQIQKFAWDGQRFVTIFVSGMPECRGSFDYITTYRRDVNLVN
jgi:Protein of unknown function (DUF1176)